MIYKDEINPKTLTSNDNLMANGSMEGLERLGIFINDVSNNSVRNDVPGTIDEVVISVGNNIGML